MAQCWRSVRQAEKGGTGVCALRLVFGLVLGINKGGRGDKSRIKGIGTVRCEPTMTERCSLWSALSAAACCFYRGSFMQVQVSVFMFCFIAPSTYKHSECTYPLSSPIFGAHNAWLGWCSGLTPCSLFAVLAACNVKLPWSWDSDDIIGSWVSDRLCENTVWIELEGRWRRRQGFGGVLSLCEVGKSSGMNVYYRRVRDRLWRAH